ncbi:unnamed protein product, partial [Phaeothamnion confervicola]
MELKNAGELPARFAIRCPTHFTAAPPRGILQPSQTIGLIISFSPAQLGPFR